GGRESAPAAAVAAEMAPDRRRRRAGPGDQGLRSVARQEGGEVRYVQRPGRRGGVRARLPDRRRAARLARGIPERRDDDDGVIQRVSAAGMGAARAADAGPSRLRESTANASRPRATDTLVCTDEKRCDEVAALRQRHGKCTIGKRDWVGSCPQASDLRTFEL